MPALTPAQYRPPLGRRPYDLRHATVSLRLNSGVPATEVARRAGHGVAVLLKIYAHCIDERARRRLGRVFRAWRRGGVRARSQAKRQHPTRTKNHGNPDSLSLITVIAPFFWGYWN
jgi:hypothetical protein